MTLVKINKINVILIAVALIASSLVFSANAASAPSLSGESVNVTGPHSVKINVTINPNGSATDIYFKYRTGSSAYTDSIYGNVTSSGAINNWGLIGLLEGTTYSYQVEARNSYGTAIGGSGTFTTSGANTSTTGSTTTTNTNTSNTSNGTGNSGSTSQGAPLVATNGPASVTTNSAVINGSVNPNSNSTSFWFEFGTSQSLGQVTTTQFIGSGNTWQLVVGNLTNLENNRTYYYRVVGRNNYGTIPGDIRNFTTGTGQTSGTGQSNGTNQNGGQVLGAVSGSGSGTSTGSNSSSSSGTVKTTTTTSTSTSTQPKASVNKNPRPSFISLEYSLGNEGALVLVANNLKPKPGEEFTYTVVYKNDTANSFNETKLKVIIPTEVDYVGANTEPLRISGTVIEFDLSTIAPLSQSATVITVRVKETVEPGTNMIFTSVLGYKDRNGTQLATTSYMTVKVGQGGSVGISLSAFSLGSLTSSTGILILVAIGLVVLMSRLTYRFVKMRNGKNKKKEEDDIFGQGGIPSTFAPVSDGSFPRR